MLYPNFGSWFYDFVTISQFCHNSVVAKIASQSTAVMLISTMISTNYDTASLSWWCTALHADHLHLLLLTVTNVNNEWTDFAAISLPKVTANEIYTCYGTMWELYTNEKSKIITACVLDAVVRQLMRCRTFCRNFSGNFVVRLFVNHVLSYICRKPSACRNTVVHLSYDIL